MGCAGLASPKGTLPRKYGGGGDAAGGLTLPQGAESCYLPSDGGANNLFDSNSKSGSAIVVGAGVGVGDGEPPPPFRSAFAEWLEDSGEWWSAALSAVEEGSTLSIYTGSILDGKWLNSLDARLRRTICATRR